MPCEDHKFRVKEIDLLKAITKADAKEIGSYTHGTGLRGENKDLEARLNVAEGHLRTICMGLEESEIPLPPPLLDWWLGHQKDQEHETGPN